MYIINKDRRIRRKTEYIILSSVRNTQEDFSIEPDLLVDNTMFTWGIWQNYYIDYLQKKLLPCHYFIEKVESDWVIYKGLNIFQPSYFIEDLVSCGVINRNYMNAILILIGQDYSKYTVDKRMSQHLSDKVLTELMRNYKIDFNHIKYIDECFTKDWKENLKFSNIKYKIEPERYFDRQVIKEYVDKYNKK